MTSVYSSRTQGEHLGRIYMTRRKREKICIRWQMKWPVTLQIITVKYKSNFFLLKSRWYNVCTTVPKGLTWINDLLLFIKPSCYAAYHATVTLNYLMKSFHSTIWKIFFSGCHWVVVLSVDCWVKQSIIYRYQKPFHYIPL
jgi:hypothetical protein